MTRWTDQRLEVVISVLLRTGVLIAAAVVLLGGACFLSRHGQEQAEYRAFHGTAAIYRSVAGVVHNAGPSNCPAVIQLGLLLLILTPVARVAFSLAGFALERDGTYVALTALVLGILIYSLTGAH
jgi:uncharacterized membrane protein